MIQYDYIDRIYANLFNVCSSIDRSIDASTNQLPIEESKSVYALFSVSPYCPYRRILEISGIGQMRRSGG